MSRTTKAITYNIAERGRKYVGQDRSNVDIGSMVDMINAPATQEMVNTGDMYGYYGHEIRMLYGMNPPDTVVTDDGREIRIAPAIRTIELSADKNGNVTHREEFLSNEAGEYAYQQYKANIGGFSTAVNFAPSANGMRYVNGFFGFDYVRNPNYHTNKGNGLFDGLDLSCGFDSIANPTDEQISLRQVVEQSLITQYDSIYQVIHAKDDVATAKDMIDFYQQEALASQQQLQDYISRQERLAKKRLERKEALLDGMICPSVPFSQFLEEIRAFDSVPLKPLTDDEQAKSKIVEHYQRQADGGLGGILKMFGS
ncbi:hypothetical protein ACGTJS_11045 [Faucicola mancuniensis]|uniref:hypothetical protein n=1 Tax=Faucicola mancuniensis TaxID=1309795 RepID=UPI0039775B75